jgi:hypothetical protein
MEEKEVAEWEKRKWQSRRVGEKEVAEQDSGRMKRQSEIRLLVAN